MGIGGAISTRSWLVTPTHATLEAALDSFRTSRVDLGPQVTKYGRTVRDDVIAGLERLSVSIAGVMPGWIARVKPALEKA